MDHLDTEYWLTVATNMALHILSVLVTHKAHEPVLGEYDAISWLFLFVTVSFLSYIKIKLSRWKDSPLPEIANRVLRLLLTIALTRSVFYHVWLPYGRRIERWCVESACYLETYGPELISSMIKWLSGPAFKVIRRLTVYIIIAMYLCFTPYYEFFYGLLTHLGETRWGRIIMEKIRMLRIEIET